MIPIVLFPSRNVVVLLIGVKRQTVSVKSSMPIQRDSVKYGGGFNVEVKLG